ncbi:N-acetylmuramoyl-L-alanine amidase [Streptomyces sp. NPDC048290]|uniref:N-acetylmuramoyl-L-alanine amidase n=1 Tax=Streptomyces sp. NPDC048290 TaxID=3155811 RepID=UPI00341E00C5
MSYRGPDFEPSPTGRPRRSVPTVVLAVLVPGALIGWLVYEAAAGGGDGGPSAAQAPASASSPAGGGPSAPDDAKKPTPGPATTATTPQPPSPSTAPPAPPGPAVSGALKGKVVVVDPGHNPGNFQHTAEINRKVDIGSAMKECDTTGTSTNDGYLEARFTLDVAHRLRDLLQAQGATVKLTHDADRPFGPCIDERARIGNEAKADAVVSIHADGSGAGNRGFHVILPGSVTAGGADTRPILATSKDLGERIAGNFLRETGTPPSNYVGERTGLVTRTDLGGLNLSTVPKVFVECGNMRNATDAAQLTSGDWRQRAAKGISEGIVSFLRG